MNCQEFQTQLPALISCGVDLESHPHPQTCALCRGLVNDLKEIAEAARQLFPRDIEPPDNLNLGDDGNPDPGVLPILPKSPKGGRGSAIHLNADSE